MNKEDTIYNAFETTAIRRDAHPAVIYIGTRFSYRSIRRLSEQFAAGLLAKGFAPGQRVILYIPNSIQWVVAFLGVQRANGVCVPITPIYTPKDLAFVANDCEATAIVCADTNFGYVRRVLPETRLNMVVITKMAELLPWWKKAFGKLFNIIPKGRIARAKNVYSMGALLSRNRSGRDLPPVSRTGEDIAEILYTGGTTRHPKSVPLTHRLFLVSAEEQIRISESLFPAEENVNLCNAPLFHVLGQT